MLKQILFILIAASVFAGIENVNVTVIKAQDYSNIWLGFSTGGYDLIAEKGTDFVFKLYVKNGMPDDSINNIKVSPQGFDVNSITPKTIEYVKPMEIVIFTVNMTVTDTTGTIPANFDISADQFPKGVFTLESEIEVVEEHNIFMYATYTILIIAIITTLIYRKYKR